VLQAVGVEVAEVSRPDRAARGRRGKSDPLDAYTAAHAALAGRGVSVPRDAHTGALRALLSARRSAGADFISTASLLCGHREDRYPPTHLPGEHSDNA
jgi:transposase